MSAFAIGDRVIRKYDPRVCIIERLYTIRGRERAVLKCLQGYARFGGGYQSLHSRCLTSALVSATPENIEWAKHKQLPKRLTEHMKRTLTLWHERGGTEFVSFYGVVVRDLPLSECDIHRHNIRKLVGLGYLESNGRDYRVSAKALLGLGVPA